MATYAEVLGLILGDLHRPSMTAEAVVAMTNMRDKVRMDRYWFNEATWGFVSTSNSEYDVATNLPDMLAIDKIRIQHNGDPLPLERGHWEDLYALDDDTYTGPPTHWAVHHQMLRLYPTPDVSYSVEAIGLKDLSISAWCSYAPTLVRAIAEVELFALVTHDMEGAARAMEVAKAEREYLLRRSPTFQQGGEVRPYL